MPRNAAPRRFRAATASGLALAGLVLTTLQGAVPAQAAGGSFTLYDNTTYNNAHLAQYGAVPSAVIYDGWSVKCANTAQFSCNLPPQADFQAKVAFYAGTVPSTSPVTLDLEGIDFTAGTPAAQAKNDFLAWQTLVQWAREAIPASQPLGVYSYDYDLNATEIGYNAQLHQEGLDYFAPSLYTHSTDPTQFTGYLNQAVANDHAAAPGQPVYPYVWPQWDLSGKPNSFLDAATWSSELNQLKASTQGAVVWSGESELDASACGWVSATRQFTATGDAADSGALSVQASLPGGCSLTRGETAQVPLTVTNTGTTTTGSTRLTVTGPDGVDATAAPSNVPALAPGQSWTTKAVIHTGMSVPLGDTTLSYRTDAGTWHQTVLVEDRDLAQGAPATQSSTNGTASAALAVDGNTDPLPADDSVSETTVESQPWLQVDLGHRQQIGAVSLWTGYGTPALAGYYVVVSDQPDAPLPTAPIAHNTWVRTQPGTWVMFVGARTFRYPQYTAATSVYSNGSGAVTDVPVGHGGRYVRVQLAGTGQLALAELQVRPGQAVTMP